MEIVTLTVPATTANLGPGFDCIGAGLTLYNRFSFTLNPETPVKITVKGAEAERVSTDKTNLIYQCFAKLYQYLGKPVPNVEIAIELGVPLARGLGSSATAIIGGLMGANYLAGSPLDRAEIMELAIATEKHPDNVVPSLLGNCQLCVGKPGNWQTCQIPWHEDIIPVLAIPDFELSTEAARSVLPKQINYADAVFNISRMGLLLRGLETGRGDWLAMAMEDQLHQPYRQSLIKGYDNLKKAALAAGAYGMVISGAGPTLLALTSADVAKDVTMAMRNAWKDEGVSAKVLELSLDSQGARIVED